MSVSHGRIAAVETVLRSRRVRLYPTKVQSRALEKAADARRFAYNWTLERILADRKPAPSQWSIMRELVEFKRSPEGEWLTSADSQVVQQAVRDAARTGADWRSGKCARPRFRSRKLDRQRFRVPQRVTFSEWRVRCPKVGSIRCRGGQTPESAIKTATFVKEPGGRWFASLVVEVGAPAKAANIERPVGIDLGLVDLIVRSDGARVPAPRFLARDARRLRRSHRDLSRKTPGSSSRRRARERITKLYRMTANKRRDFIHKRTRELIDGFDLICVEDINLRGLARTKLARSAADAAFGELRRQLLYKSETADTRVVVIDRFFPSSKRCSRCGSLNSGLNRRTRVWSCVCGALHDRDRNAALNLLDEGLRYAVAAGYADTPNARGVDSKLGCEQSAKKREPGPPPGCHE